MLKLGCTYFVVKDMEKSISFYEALLEIKATSKNLNRWAQFQLENNSIALFNPEFDLELIMSNRNLDAHYNNEYLLFKQNNKIRYGNNAILNFNVPDLKVEYERIKKLNIGNVTEIMYINIVAPYYCFMLEDPDGNLLEITGKYELENL
jgi:catechol 2,3-dioxygenase-like lactoylglutathione lyase family enzyme